MKALLLAILLVLAPTAALSDTYIIRGGAHAKLTGTVKTFSVRHESLLFGPIKTAKELGFWVDNVGQGGKDSLFGKYAVGVTPGANTGLFGKAFIGIAALTYKDALLGGNFQFTQDFGFGIRGVDSHIAIVYTHFSSAGLYRPNKGRDFVTVEAGLNF